MPKYKPNPDYSPSAEWLESLYFHHPDKGCTVYFASVNKCPNLTKHHKKCPQCDWVARGRCKTHKVLVCHGAQAGVICGWEFSHHFNDTPQDKYYRFM